jgi:hypothetical protein
MPDSKNDAESATDSTQQAKTPESVESMGSDTGLRRGEVLIGETVFADTRTWNIFRRINDYLLDAFR